MYKLIITISGQPGSGKSTLAKKLAEKLGLKHYSTGDLWREIAKERKVTPLELNKTAEKEPSIDYEIDERTKKLGMEQDNFVMDSRVAWHFIPKSLKIFVKADLREVAKRIFGDERKEEKENKSLEETLKSLQQRMKIEEERYKRLYGLNYLDEKNYDLVLDTTNLKKEQTLQKALEFIEKQRQ